MKKNLLFLFLFTFFLFPFNSYALSFTDCNDVEHTIDYSNNEEFRDFCYFTHYSNDNSATGLITFANINGRSKKCIVSLNSNKVIYDSNTSYLTTNNNDYIIYDYYRDSYSNTYNGSGISDFDPLLQYSTYTVLNTNNETFFQSNFTIQNILDKYSCNSGSVDPDPEPEEPTVDPITKEDFYILLVMFSTLIWLIYFKWCFPMTKGRDLK